MPPPAYRTSLISGSSLLVETCMYWDVAMLPVTWPLKSIAWQLLKTGLPAPKVG